MANNSNSLLDWVKQAESPMQMNDQRCSFHRSAGLSKTDAEALLDWLDAHQCRSRLVTGDPLRGFAIEYAAPDDCGPAELMECC